MSKEKKPGVRELGRAEKRAIRDRIASLQNRIATALTAPRVPARILNGDVIAVQKWKVAVDTNFYHMSFQPSPDHTAKELLDVEKRLTDHLAKIA